MAELKTSIIALSHLAGEGAHPVLTPELTFEPGVTPELLTVVHPRTKRRSQVFKFEAEIAKALFDGLATIDQLLARMRSLGHPVTHDQLAGFVVEMSRLGVAQDTLGIEPSRRVIALPWREGPEPEVVVSGWAPDARRQLKKGLDLFRAGRLNEAVPVLGPLMEVPQAMRASRRLVELTLQATGIAVVPQAVAPSAGPAAAPSPVAPGVDAPVESGFGDDGGFGADLSDDDIDDDWVKEATEVLSREDLIAALAEDDERASAFRLSAEAARKGVRIALLSTLILAFASLVPAPFNLRYPCVVEPRQPSAVRAGLGAVVVEMTVAEGDHVEQGQVVGRLADGEHRVAVARVRADLEQAEAERRLLEGGSRDETVAGLEARTGALYRAAGIAKRAYERLVVDQRAGRAAQTDLERARAAQVRLSAEAQSSQAELDLARAGARTEDIDKAAAEIDALKAELGLAELLVQGATLRATSAGTITTRAPHRLVGQSFEVGETVLEIATVSDMIAVIDVDEREFDALTMSAPVDVRIAALPDRAWTSTVERIRPDVVGPPTRRRVLVQAALDNDDGALAPGMTGWAEISAGHQPLLSLALRRSLRWFRVALLF